MTYKEAYTEHLRNKLGSGGTPAEMEEAVTEFNTVERANWSGSSAFTKWAEAKTHICERCDRRFTPEPGNPIDVAAVVDCAECVKNAE
jgi:hypothetical protein